MKTDISVMGRILEWVGIKKRLNSRPIYEAAIDSSKISPEQRRQALENAAADPEIGAALDEADRAYERHLKGAESGELRRRSITPGPSRR